MSPELQQVTIADWCHDHSPSISTHWHDSNFLTDLNAMHEAEKVLTESPTAWADQRTIYSQKLFEILSNGHGRTIFNFDLVHATAAQRAEAFLRTIGKWPEAQP